MMSRTMLSLLLLTSSVAAFISTHPRTFVARACKNNNALQMSTSNTEESWEDGFSRERSNLDDNSRREERMQFEDSAKARFVTGDLLHDLRKQVLELRQELVHARKSDSEQKVNELERAIIKAQKVDAEFVYSVARERMEQAELDGDIKNANIYKKEADAARTALPQFNLHGLWVGKYGTHGYEMINVTYVDDTLIAVKVTGDKNVPKGQVSFTADLTPGKINDALLQPIELSDDATRQWGTKHLARFGGKGQVAAEGFVNSQWLDGQLILVGDYFSFAWVPLGHQVFFGRPSAELTLKMLTQQSRKPEDQDREHLMRCLEETEIMEDDYHVESEGKFQYHEQHNHYDQEGCFE